MKQLHIVLRANLPSGAFPPDASGRALEAIREMDVTTLATTDLDEIDTGRVPALRREPGVVGVAPTMPMKLIEPIEAQGAAPAQPAAGSTAWGITAVGADTSTLTGKGVIVAVLDTGIAADHPAFKVSGLTVLQQDFTGEGNGDKHGHGTHCAGTIFGRPANGIRIGVAPGVTTALIAKVIGSKGASNTGVVDAILWAAGQGAHVISMSLGIDFPGYQAILEAQGLPKQAATSLALEGYRSNLHLFEQFAAYLKTLGDIRAQATLLVAAAGNESRANQTPPYKIAVSPPAVASGFVSVAALGESPEGLAVAPFSNTGAIIAAPGVGIVSANKDGGLTTMSGTSMATPHVAGVAALWAQRLLNKAMLSVDQLTAELRTSAVRTPLRPDVDPGDVGAGVVQAPQQ